MGTITIRFIGLAVHLDQKHAPELDAEHRVVLLGNAHQKTYLERPVEPHQAVLIFPNQATQTLEDVLVSVPNAKGPGFSKHPSFDKVPRLTPGDVSVPGLDPDVAYRGKTDVSAYFDTDFGVLTACTTRGGAVGTRLKIETEGNPLLALTPFVERPYPPYRFDTEHVVITIMNIALEEKDDKFDFVLSYRILSTIPFEPHIPEGKVEGLPECGGPLAGDLGPACSNSSYP